MGDAAGCFSSESTSRIHYGQRPRRRNDNDSGERLVGDRGIAAGPTFGHLMPTSTPSEPAPPWQQGSPRWLSPPTLRSEAYDASTLSQAFEGSCTAPTTHNAPGHLPVPPGRWPSATVCNRRPSFYLSDGADQRPPTLPGRRRLRCSASGPMSFGDLPRPGLGSLVAAPPLRPMPPTFSAQRSPATRDFDPTQGFKQRGAPIAELSMPAKFSPHTTPPPSPALATTPGAPA